MARPICLRLLLHCMRAAASRTFWTAGSSRPMRMAMMAITTNSSISVKAAIRRNRRDTRVRDDRIKSLNREEANSQRAGVGEEGRKQT